jgi:predicted metal-dependent hydrolase
MAGMSDLWRHPQLATPVRLKRSPRARRMSLKFDPAQREAVLTLPPRISQQAGMRFLSDQLPWLQERLAALPAALPFLPGLTLPLLGRPHLLAGAPAARRGVWAEDGVIHVSGDGDFFARRVGDFLRQEARRHIAERAVPMAERIGRSVAAIRIGDPKSRWGSCNSKGRLAFSWRLVLAPDEVLSYVVAHEVAHLREMNHSPRFWEWVRTLQADIDGPRRWLKANGAALYRYGAR